MVRRTCQGARALSQEPASETVCRCTGTARYACRHNHLSCAKVSQSRRVLLWPSRGEPLFPRSPSTHEQAAVDELAAKVGAPLALAGFQRISVGEGIEREAKDFAAEVAAAARV